MSGVGRSGQANTDGSVLAQTTGELTRRGQVAYSGSSPTRVTGGVAIDRGDGYERSADGATTRAKHQDGVAAPAMNRVEPRRTTISVHGIKLDVEYDPAWASKSDVATVERGLNRYPPAWIQKAVEAGKERGEEAPSIRMVAQKDMGVDNPPEGRYDPESNVIYLNMEAFNDPQQRSYLKDAHGNHFSGSAWLERTAIHEVAHYLDDAGTKDVRRGFDDMATFAGPLRQVAAGMPKHREVGQGKFRRGVIDRNGSEEGPRAYVTEYDRRTNQGKDAMAASEHETFAEIVTVSVLGGQAKRDELLANPELKDLAGAVYRYLDRGADIDQLSG